MAAGRKQGLLDDSGYLAGHDIDEDLKDCEGLKICSCGHYKLLTVERFETSRPEGRQDWQLLYVAGGRVSFTIGGKLVTLTDGNAVLYRPQEPQHYIYLEEEQPEIYWVHFSGRHAPLLLEELDLADKSHFFAGVQECYCELFEEIIRELQLKPQGFEWAAAGLAQQLFAALARGGRSRSGGEEDLIRKAAREMHQTYREETSIAEYAQKYNMSLCWFIRSFKAQTGLPPNQYLIQIRINRARELLHNTSLNVGEIAALVGYENPLYFSRLFKQATGRSPRQYRDAIKS